MRTKIVVGSRSSQLALIQAESVAAKLREANPDIEISLSKIATEGDRRYRTQFTQMAGIGVFVKELEEALLDGRIDLAVHSLKDMPTEIPAGLCLAAVTKRLDPRDVLVSRSKTLAELAPGARIGTGSPRRTLQLSRYRPDLKVLAIRGNIDTRLGKVAKGELDGIILAAAALIRLGWQDRISDFLPVEPFLPAVGQGALALEIRRDDDKITNLISSLNDPSTWQEITAERALLRALGGGCRAPIAALGTASGNSIKLDGMVADTSGKQAIYAAAEGQANAPEEIGKELAQKLLDMGAADFLDEVKAE